MELLETQLSDSKQNVDRLELQLIHLQRHSKTLEEQLVSIWVGEVDEGLIQVQCLCMCIRKIPPSHIILHNMYVAIIDIKNCLSINITTKLIVHCSTSSLIQKILSHHIILKTSYY